MPQNTPMKRQFTTIDGRTVMSNLPQHWGGNDWAITGVDNPLPVGNYVQTEAGVWIPQKGSDDGAVYTRLTGSNVEDGLPVITKGNVEISSTRGVEIAAGSGAYLIRWKDVSEFTRLFAYVLSDSSHDFRMTFDFRDGASSQGVSNYVKVGENYDSEGNRNVSTPIIDITFPQVDIYIRNRSEQTHKYDGVVRGLRN